MVQALCLHRNGNFLKNEIALIILLLLSEILNIWHFFKTMFLLVCLVDLVDQLDQDDVSGSYLWAEPPMRVGILGVHRRHINRFLLCDLQDEILLIILRHLIWTNGCYMGYLRFTFPNSKQIFFLLNYLCKQKHMMRFYVNPPLRDILGYPKFHLGKWYQWSISSLGEGWSEQRPGTKAPEETWDVPRLAKCHHCFFCYRT